MLVAAVVGFGRGRLMRILNPWYAPADVQLDFFFAAGLPLAGTACTFSPLIFAASTSKVTMNGSPWKAEGTPSNSITLPNSGLSFEAGTPVALFSFRVGPSLRNHFTVTADGQRFLVDTLAEVGGTEHFNVLLNGPATFKH